MVTVEKYLLAPTALIPNSSQPLLHYKGALSEQERLPHLVYDILEKNGWKTQWIFRYGPTQISHYHSQIHEAMVVLSGTATIRFGVADTDADLEKNTWGTAYENGGVEIAANAGDVFVIPAGVAHKTYNTSPAAPFNLLTPGRGRGIAVPNPREMLSAVTIEGFTMMGAYPKNCGDWDFSIGGEDVGNYKVSWDIPRPELDPIMGDSHEGILGQWRAIPLSQRINPISKL